MVYYGRFWMLNISLREVFVFVVFLVRILTECGKIRSKSSSNKGTLRSAGGRSCVVIGYLEQGYIQRRGHVWFKSTPLIPSIIQ